MTKQALVSSDAVVEESEMRILPNPLRRAPFRLDFGMLRQNRKILDYFIYNFGLSLIGFGFRQ